MKILNIFRPSKLCFYCTGDLLKLDNEVEEYDDPR